MATIDVDELRQHLTDYCGTAAFSGFPAAAIDLIDVQSADGYELCRAAERLGVDLRRFEVDRDS